MEFLKNLVLRLDLIKTHKPKTLSNTIKTERIIIIKKEKNIEL